MDIISVQRIFLCTSLKYLLYSQRMTLNVLLMPRMWWANSRTVTTLDKFFNDYLTPPLSILDAHTHNIIQIHTNVILCLSIQKQIRTNVIELRNFHLKVMTQTKINYSLTYYLNKLKTFDVIKDFSSNTLHGCSWMQQHILYLEPLSLRNSYILGPNWFLPQFLYPLCTL